MDWMTFTILLVKPLAWPVTVLLAIFLLRNTITQIFPRLKKFKHKDTEIEFFEERLKELEDEKQEPVNETLRDPSGVSDLDESYEFISRLADISPRSAVLESFIVLESASHKALRQRYPDSRSRYLPTQKHLIESDILDSHQLKQFKELRILRNQAAHMDDFDMKGMPIGAYIDTALTLAKAIESKIP